MNKIFDSIAAISSGQVNQPISIIRVSGSDSFDIVKKVFTGKVGTDRTISYGYIVDGEEKVDEVLVMWYKGPNTFTGEDIVEINAHGGVVNSNRILKILLANGARMALHGEFSQRAFLNGKMDLMKAEGIHDLIFAKSEEQAKLSFKKFDGRTSKLIDNLRGKMMYVIATIETNIDYPEYDDVETLSQQILLPKLREVKEDIAEIKRVSTASKYIFEGVSVAIVGRPNAGKSSLLNALTGFDKAIVTDIPGTTRDVVESQVQVGQVLLNFKDTAGIHDTNDKVESLGIEKSLSMIDSSDLVIHLLDGSKEEDSDDKLIEERSNGKKYIKVFNKNDITRKDVGISISAKENDVKELLDAIESHFETIDLNDDRIVYNTRQLALIDSSFNSINDSINGLSMGMEPDEVIVDVREAWISLSNIAGRADQDDILDTMFRNFCLGK